MKNNENEMLLNEYTKVCSRCNINKTYDNFVKDSKSKDGLKSSCKECIKIYGHIYRIDNNYKIQEYNKLYRSNNKEKINKTIKTYQNNNKEKLYECSRVYHKTRYNQDPEFKLRRLLRDRILKLIINKNTTKTALLLLGCNYDYFKFHLESQFKPEMTWSNHGEIWEIDHIKPCSSFNLADIEQQKQCFHYSNTQPLFKTTEIAESLGYENEIGNRNKSDNKK